MSQETCEPTMPGRVGEQPIKAPPAQHAHKNILQLIILTYVPLHLSETPNSFVLSLPRRHVASGASLTRSTSSSPLTTFWRPPPSLPQSLSQMPQAPGHAHHGGRAKRRGRQDQEHMRRNHSMDELASDEPTTTPAAASATPAAIQVKTVRVLLASRISIAL